MIKIVRKRPPTNFPPTPSGPDVLVRNTALVDGYFQTTLPDGLLIGWDTCGSCNRHIRRCNCGTVTIPSRVTRCLAPPTPAIEPEPGPKSRTFTVKRKVAK